MHIVLWRRQNQQGHDACRFREVRDGWIIEGSAIFEHKRRVTSLTYRLTCDRRWSSMKASVAGWGGENDIELLIEREGAKRWRINGRIVEALTGLEDIDLGFTPATNTNAIRRLNLSEGDEAKSRAVWLDAEDWTVKPLSQTYRRSHRNAYNYTSPQHGYQATLLVDDFGAIIEYPDLWVMTDQRET